MNKRRQNNTEELHPAFGQGCNINDQNGVLKPSVEPEPDPASPNTDTAVEPTASDCGESDSEHRLEFVMKMPDCIVDPESREKAIRYFQQEQGGTKCWEGVKAFLETAECTVDENGNPHFSNQLNTLNELTLQETISDLDWAWRNTLFDIFLQSGMVDLNVKPQ